MTLVEFLLARIAEVEASANNYLVFEVRDGVPGNYAIPDRVRSECEAKRRIVEFHESWPVLVESPPAFDNVDPADLNSMTYRMSKQIAWTTQEQYRVRFGEDPPTAPMLAVMAEVYADHPDYREEWRM